MPEELWPHGSSPKDGAPEGFWLTSADILGTLPGWTEPLQWFARTIPITYIYTASLCAKQPIEYGDVDIADLLGAVVNPFAFGDLTNQLISRGQRSMWHTYCELNPAPDPIADPTPDPYPVPDEPEPPDVPELPIPPPVTDDDLGMLIQMIFGMLSKITKDVDRNQILITYLCDNCQTLNYDLGDNVVISGHGSAMLEPADGYRVVLDELPGYIGHSEGDPPTLFDAGWFGFGQLGEGFSTARLSRQAQTFYPAGIETHQIYWELPVGVTGVVYALKRQPYPDAPPRGLSFGG